MKRLFHMTRPSSKSVVSVDV